MPISFRHVIWIELRFATDGRDTCRADNAVHDHVRDMHTLRPKLARERLHQPTQRELRAAKGQPTAGVVSSRPSPADELALCSNTLIVPSSARTRSTADLTSAGRLTSATSAIAFPPPW